jgi:hypothetical protein
MFCPSCGTENLDDINFCRKCRANLSLVPQALTGQLPQTSSRRHKKGKDQDPLPRMESAIQKAFGGVGFLLVAFAALFFAPAGRIWWFWMLIPAFGMLGKAVSEYYCVKNSQQNFPQANHQVNQQAIQPPPTPVSFQPRDTGEMVQTPPSVTESTTKLFDPPAQ